MASDKERRDSDRNAKRRSDHEPTITRRDLGSWIEGPPRFETGTFPGQGLGLAESGSTSMAGYGRRIVALCADWAVAVGISALAFDAEAWATSVIFFVLTVTLLSLFGTTVGKWLLRIQVVRVGGAPMNVLKVLIRTALLMLVIPVVIIDSEGRGLHDRLADSVEIRM